MNNKLIINTNLLRKESEFRTKSCAVEKAIAVSHCEFENLKRHPLQDNDLIAENTDLMYCDSDDIYHCLLIYDKEQGDGLLIEAEGSSYARYAQYIPKARDLVERHQNPEIQLTNGERKLHELLNETAEKKMLVEAAAEILNERRNIQSVKIHDLDVPFQPDISVEIKEENSECEYISEEPDMGMTM